MVNSAISTGNYFNVTVGDRALHCLPANFIAGKMMLIRAMILGLEIDLISPSKMPFYKNDKSYDFVAMTPIIFFCLFESFLSFWEEFFYFQKN